MKRNVVRLLGLLLSALIAVGAFVSCNKRETPTPNPKTEENRETEASNPPSQTTERSEETTKKPEETTKKPEETTVKPEETTKPAATVTLNQSTLTLTKGERARLTAIVTNAEGMALKWSSSAPDIVSVDNGEVVARDVGTATITVSLPNGAFATCTIQVDPKPVEIGVYIDGTLVETLTTTVENNYRITMPEKPQDITTDHNADRYFYGWFTDSSLNTPLTEEMTFPNGGKIYGKWIPINFSDYTYTVNYGKATITGAKQTTDTIVVIPSYINSFPVVEIAADVFKDRTMIRRLIICDGIERIGSGVFNNCNSMMNIMIPNSVTSIGKSAFEGCSSLTGVYITNPAKWCGISFESYNANPLYYAHHLYLNKTLVTELVIPNGVTSIGDYAFHGCSSLTSITIPNSVTSIGYKVFSDCSGLTSITIPNGVTSIGSYAFSGCTGLTNITLGNGVTSIGTFAFSGCSSLTGVYITDLAKWCGISFGGDKFESIILLGSDYANPLYYAHNLYLNGALITDLVIPEGVTSISNYAFYNCNSLTSITMPYSVTSIGKYAFSGCSSLTSITIPDSVTSIGDYAFRDCSSLTSITIPNSVTSIGAGTFFGCSILTSIILPFVGENADGTGKIGFRYIFGGSNDIPASLKTVVITGETSIGYQAFYDCSSLTRISLGNGVTSIGPYAFYKCSSLTSITIGNGVTRIYENAFHECNSLMSITIPNSVTSIGGDAFYGCSSLTSVMLSNGVTSIGGSTFYGCSKLTSIALPDSVKSINSSAFYGCSSLTEITIPDSVTVIQYYAFRSCRSLRKIIYKGTKAQWNAISKGPDWDVITGAYTVYCSDGEIEKQS